MLTFKHTNDGYEFYLSGKFIAIGAYTKLGFELSELDESVTVHGNGVVASVYLKEKYIPNFYQGNQRFVPKPYIQPFEMSKFKNHPALKGVSPMEKYDGRG